MDQAPTAPVWEHPQAGMHLCAPAAHTHELTPAATHTVTAHAGAYTPQEMHRLPAER